MNALTLNPTILYIISGIVTTAVILIAYKFISRRQRQLLQARIDEATAAQGATNAGTRDADADDEHETSSEESSGDTDEKRFPGDGSPKKDPVEFCEHIQSEVKKAHQAAAIKSTVGEMTSEEKETEREIQSKQLEAILKLMNEQNEKFGMNSMDQIQNQMKLYA